MWGLRPMPPTLWEAFGVLWVGRVGVWGLALGSWRFARLVSRAALAVLAVGVAWGLALRRSSRLLLAESKRGVSGPKRHF